jgi:hypothetical protein
MGFILDAEYVPNVFLVTDSNVNVYMIPAERMASKAFVVSKDLRFADGSDMWVQSVDEFRYKTVEPTTLQIAWWLVKTNYEKWRTEWLG